MSLLFTLFVFVVPAAQSKLAPLSAEENKILKSLRITPATLWIEAHDFSGEKSDGKTVHLKDFRGSFILLNFWATWCKPCIKELPYFEEVTQQYADDKLKVILVSLDFPDKLKDQVAPFVEKRNLKSQVVLLDDPDANGWIPKVSEEWSGAIPATVIYKNNERRFYEKSFTREELFEEIKSIH